MHSHMLKEHYGVQAERLFLPNFMFLWKKSDISERQIEIMEATKKLST